MLLKYVLITLVLSMHGRRSLTMGGGRGLQYLAQTKVKVGFGPPNIQGKKDQK